MEGVGVEKETKNTWLTQPYFDMREHVQIAMQYGSENAFDKSDPLWILK